MEFEWLMKLLRSVFQIVNFKFVDFFFENQIENGRMSAGQAKTVKKVCKGNNENCIAIAERIFEKMQTKKIGNGLSKEPKITQNHRPYL